MQGFEGTRHPGSAAAFGLARPQPFAVDVRRRDDVAIVRPHGELDLATVQTLQDALSGLNQALPFGAADADAIR